MVSKTFRSRTKRPAVFHRRKDDRPLNRDPEKETFLLYPFDDRFFDGYARFYDRVKNTVEDAQIHPDLAMHMEHVVSPYAMVDVLLHEKMDNTCMSEAMMDEVYGVVNDTDCASTVIEHIIDFCNSDCFPIGFDVVLEILLHSPGFLLIDFYPVREEDAMVYVLINGESE